MKKILELKRDNIISRILVLIGGGLGVLGFFLFKNDSTDNIFFLLIIIPAILFIFFSIWFKTEVLIVKDDILEKTNFFGFIKRKRELRNLKSIKRGRGNLFMSPSSNPLALLSLFLKNPKYSNFTILTLTFKDEKKLGLSELLYDRKDFIYLNSLMKEQISKNRKRFKKEDRLQ